MIERQEPGAAASVDDRNGGRLFPHEGWKENAGGPDSSAVGVP